LQCCSAWQKRQTMDGVAGAFVEHRHLFLDKTRIY
jgi:hypothetical protein